MKKSRSIASMVFMMGLYIFLSISLLPFQADASNEFPNKDITLYVAYGAGGVADQCARALAEEAGKILGVSVIVENKPGGSATVGAALVATKKPDGYSLGTFASGVLTSRPFLFDVSFRPFKDFVPIMAFTRYHGGICVRADSPWKTAQEFIEYAKSHPGMSYSSSGTYIQQQLSVEILARCKGLKFNHVPFTGGMEDITALLGGHVQFLAGAGQHLRFTRQGKLRMLVVVNQENRNPEFPDVPTLKELGCNDLTGLSLIVVAPKDLPDNVRKKLEDSLKKASQQPGFQKVLKFLDMNYIYLGGKELETYLQSEMEANRAFLKTLGVELKELKN